jgi:hypothetical protein
MPPAGLLGDAWPQLLLLLQYRRMWLLHVLLLLPMLLL